MKIVSVFNNVLGPVMRGPSSSHTAGSFHIGRLARGILGAPPKNAIFSFDDSGSYAKTYREQGSDRAFMLGLTGRNLTDDGFLDAVSTARRDGLEAEFRSGTFAEADHPNWVEIVMDDGAGIRSRVTAASIGGGSVAILSVDGFKTDLRGDAWVTLVESDAGSSGKVKDLLSQYGAPEIFEKNGSKLFIMKGADRAPDDVTEKLSAMGLRPRAVGPVFFPVKGKPLFRSAAELERYAETRNISLAEAALEYECALLGLSRREAMDEMNRRYSIMKEACERALEGRLATSMQLLRPTADKMWASGMSGKLPFFGLHTRAAIRAAAIMHANGGMEVVCAAPTGGSAGALPGAVITLEEELGLSRDDVCMALWAAGAVGLIVDTRATFAAEVAGCQVEIGAGGAMASAACVHAAGGTPRQALDAAAISFQNTMGSICDPVQGMVEIPCHTRNASAAAGAFVNADLILGGYENGIPLDETVDAVYKVGLMLPPELRCTSLGGLSVCPSALAMKRLKK